MSVLLPCQLILPAFICRSHLPEDCARQSQALLAAYARAKIPQWEKVRHALRLPQTICDA